MTKLHEVLAAEKTVNANATLVLKETIEKFGKDHFFNGQVKSLSMLEDTPANQKLEEAARVDEPLKTTVKDTLAYAFKLYADQEFLQLQKNATNRRAVANVVFRDSILFSDLPVDQLLGLEARLAEVRKVFLALPTLDAGKNWSWDVNQGCWVSTPENTVKTDKTLTFLTAAPATDKHPAQIKELTKDVVIGMFSIVRRSSAVTAVQKAEAILLVDELLAAVKQARMRANETEVDMTHAEQMRMLAAVLMSPFEKQA